MDAALNTTANCTIPQNYTISKPPRVTIMATHRIARSTYRRSKEDPIVDPKRQAEQHSHVHPSQQAHQRDYEADSGGDDNNSGMVLAINHFEWRILARRYFDCHH
jgi:hypothetical protein